MNQPIELIDISTDLASRAMAATYRNGAWAETAPTKIVGAIVDNLGYIIVVTNDTLTAVYRYTNREILKRLKMWPANVDAIVSQHATVAATSLGRAPLAGLGRREVDE